jgi:ABC-type transporter Mla maintaining outer membrane lipid asymmetry ATPase subunit MlaF
MLGRGRILLEGSKEQFRATTNQTVRDFIEGHAPETEDVASLLSSS